jgi:uncharacterized protein YjdB
MKKRLLATLLTLCLLFSLLPVGASATVSADTDATVDTTNNVVTLNAATSAGTLDEVLSELTGSTKTLDLNGYTLTIAGGGTLFTSGNSVEIVIENTKDSAAGLVLTDAAGITVSNGSTLSIDGGDKGITVTANNGTAFSVGGQKSKLTMDNVTVNAKGYCVTTDGEDTTTGVTIDLVDSTLKSSGADNNDNTAVLMDVAGTLNLDTCTVTGGRNAVVVRAGTATIKDSTLKISSAYSGTDGDWSTNGLPAAALLVGNYAEGAAESYKADAVVTVDGWSTIIGTGTYNVRGIPAIYVDGNTAYSGALTIKGLNTLVVGEIKKGQQSATNAIKIAIEGGSFRYMKKTDLENYIINNAYSWAVNYTEGSTADTGYVSTDVGIVAKIGTVGYRTLGAAISAVADGGTIELLADYNIVPRANNLKTRDRYNLFIKSNKSFTIDLGGHTLTGVWGIYLAQGDVTIQNGTVKGTTTGVIIFGAKDSKAENHAVLNIADNAVVSGDAYGIIVTGYEENASGTQTYNTSGNYGYGGVLNIEGTVSSNNTDGVGVFVMGNIGNTGASFDAMKDKENLLTINVKSGSTITAAQPLVLSGYTITNIDNDATLTGAKEAVAMKRGILNIYGGTFTAEGTKVDPVNANTNGSENSGAAISITSTYNDIGESGEDAGKLHGDITVNIEGGTFTSKNNVALYVGHSVKKSKIYPFYSGVTLSISGGTFNGATDVGAVYVAPAITTENYNSTYSTGSETAIDSTTYPTTFITSGTFNSDVSEYVQKEGAYVAVANGNGTWTVKEVPVATIGSGIYTQQFDSLQEAVEAVSESATEITLTADVAEAISVAENQNVIINLNKHTLTTTKPTGGTTVTEGITNAGTLSIKNGTIKSDNALTTVIKNTGNLTLTDVAVNLTGNTAALVPIDNQGNLTLAGSTTVPNGVKAANDNALGLAGNAQVAIKNTPIADPGSSLTVAAGTNVDVGNILIAKTNNDHKFALNIASGKFGTISTSGSTTDTITGNITGGTFDADVATYVQTDGSYKSIKDAGEATTYTVKEDTVATITTTSDDGTVTKNYDSLQEAIDAVTAGTESAAPSTATTIVLQKSTTSTLNIGAADATPKNIVLDLNGNDLTVSATALINSNSKLEIKGTGTVTAAATVTTVIQNKGELTITNATVTPSTASTLTIDNQGKLTLAGTTDVKNAKADASVLTDTPIAISNSGTSSVNVASTETDVTVGNILLDKSSAVNITLEIAAGTFGSIETKGDTGNITGNITGGTFDNNVDAYVQKGTEGVNAYKSVENGNGTYTVKVDAVASMGGNTYKTLADAISAAGSNTKEITLLESIDISEAVTISTGNITINLDNNTLTLTNNGLTVESGGTLTLKDGKVEGNVDKLIQNSGTLTLDDVTVTPGNNTSITIDNSGELTLKGSTSVPNGKKETGYAISNHTAATDGSFLIVGEETTVEVGDIQIVKTNNDYKFTLSIASGKFGTITTTTGTTTDTITGSITGGTFADNVSGYCASGYAAVAKSESEGGYEVKEATDVKLQTTTVESATVSGTDSRKVDSSFTTQTDKTNAENVANSVKVDLTEETKLVSDETQEAEEAAALEVLAKAGQLTINEDGSVTATGSDGGEDTPNATVALVRETYLDVETKDINTAYHTVTVEITQKYNLYATVLETGQEATNLKPAEMTRIKTNQTADTTDSTVAVSIKVPSTIVAGNNPDKAYITHEHTDGNGGTTTNYYTAKYNSTEQTVTFENPDGFSTFTVSFVNPSAIKTASFVDVPSTSVYIGGTIDLSKYLVAKSATEESALVESKSWTSSNPAVAKVDSATGIVTGVSVGTAKITANYDGVETTIDITVNKAVTNVTVNPTTLTLDATKTSAKHTATLSATVTPSDATVKSVTWKSSNTSIATVDESTGVVTAVAPGTAKITATSNDNQNITAECTVTVKYLVSSVSIGNNFGLKIGDEKTLSATVLPAGAKQTVTWTSSDPTVATVDQTGKITALATGKTTITATSTDDSSKSDYCVVTVSNVEVTNVGWKTTLQQPMEVGQTGKLVPLIVPENATEDVSWKSSNPDVATVDQEGNVTAIGAGTAVITVTAGTKTADFTVTVSAPPADNNGQGDGTGEGNTGDNSGTTTPPEDGSGTTTPPDDNKNEGGNTGEGNTGDNSGTTTPPDNSDTTTPPDDNQNQGGTVTPPVDDNKGEDNKNEVETPEETTTITFTDLTQDWYQDAVVWAVKKGVTNGITATTFGPNKDCTRAMVVTFLWRAAGSPEPKSTTTVFRDVNVNEYYAKAVAWAVENGITNGTSATAFSPNATCTRAQVATFLWRAANKPQPQSATTTFTDLKAGEYYETAVIWGAETGIIKGMSTTAFKPNDTCTRAQVVTFLYRAQ